ncbi:MAG: glycerol-3-phosphate acyltransferase, partial [Oscillospiraceae bacterium]
MVSIIPRGYITGFTLLAAAVAYLLGSLNFAIIVSRVLYHKDIRTFGSGNAGMTNVLRTFGKGAAALTIIGDIGKGTVSV